MLTASLSVYAPQVELEFTGEIWYWRGPAPYYFITVPEEECRALNAVSPAVSYGWGMIPATISIGSTQWTTSLFPKDGRYVVPIKVLVRRAESLDDGDVASVRVSLDM